MSPVEAREMHQRLTEIENALISGDEDKAQNLIEAFKHELYWIWQEESLTKAFDEAGNG